MDEILWRLETPMPDLDGPTSNALDLELGLTAREVKQQASYGMWWVLGFARGRLGFPRGWAGDWFGLRIMQEGVLEDSPVLFVGPEGANTFCSSQRTLVSTLWLVRWLALAPSDSDWSDARSTLQALLPSLRRLDVAFHGDGSLARMYEATFSDVLRDSRDPPDGPTRHARWCEARRRLFSAIDESPEHDAWMTFMHRSLLEEVAPWPPPQNLGPWREGCLLRGFFDNRNNEREQEETLFAWDTVRSPAALDGSCAFHDYVALPSTSTASSLWIPAEVLSNRSRQVSPEWKSDPWWEPTMALAQAGFKKYDGKAHFEAARRLDEAGRPVDALNALISANYWMVRRKPGPRFEVMAYALDLARCNGWEPLACNIEVVLHAARQMAGK
jgi:hypothetical protein